MSEHYWNQDGEFGAMLVLSLIIRIAISSGYHRDPSKLRDMSDLDAEMRRRTWAFILEMDLQLADKCGHPRIIDQMQTDTKAPYNTTNQDFHNDAVGSTDGSSPESVSSLQQAAYLSYKAKLLAMHGKVAQLVNSPQDKYRYEDVLQLDGELSAFVQNARPQHLLPVELQHGLATPDPGELVKIMEVDIVRRRAQMTLHRKYLVPAHTRPVFAYSRTVCLEAATQVLQHQQTLSSRLNAESPSARATTGEYWRFMALMNHDFLLAAMLLCLDINQDARSYASPTADSDADKHRRILRLLQASHRVWTELPGHSATAARGARAVDIMLKKLEL